MKPVVLAAAALALAGCSSISVVDRSDQKVVVQGDDALGVVRQARRECGRHDKAARLTRMTRDQQWHFDCVRDTLE